MKKVRLLSLHTLILLCLLPGFVFNVQAQSDIQNVPSGSVFKGLQNGDSLVFYQCHVEAGTQILKSVSGQEIKGSVEKYSITEKWVLLKESTSFVINYYQSSYTAFPNKKFANLKFKEKPFWQFRLTNSFNLMANDLQAFIELEQKGRDANVYDYGIDKYNTNQLIIRFKNDYKQLVIDGPYVLSKLLQTNLRKRN